jgi:ribonuclease HII
MLSFYKIDTLEAGIDEAGRGSLIGDVYAAAVILPAEIDFEVNDSKKLSARRRLILRDNIEESAIDFAVASMSNQEIDEINILNAAIGSMHKAVNQLSVQPEFLLVDGNRFKSYYDNNGQQIPHQCVVGGDAKYNSIAAASILAKVYHDQHIEKICDTYPLLDEYYDLMNNMGYGTKRHLDGIETYGITQFHRKSYKTSFNKSVINL